MHYVAYQEVLRRLRVHPDRSSQLNLNEKREGLAETSNNYGILSANVHWKWSACSVPENIRKEWIQAQEMDQIHLKSG